MLRVPLCLAWSILAKPGPSSSLAPTVLCDWAASGGSEVVLLGEAWWKACHFSKCVDAYFAVERVMRGKTEPE